MHLILMETNDLNKSDHIASDLNSTEPVEHVPAELSDPILMEEQSTEHTAASEPLILEELSKHELLVLLRQLAQTPAVESVMGEIEHIRAVFYKKLKQELEALKQEHLDSGGKSEQFIHQADPLEATLKTLYLEFKERKQKYFHQLEQEREHNAAIKLGIVEAIKDLVNRQESLNTTFHEFKELQLKWRETGPVPQDRMRDLYERYNLALENFFGYIKINKELRDLDLRKNLEAKNDLCEKAEKLLLEPSIVRAFQVLQKYHEMWHETGPVPREKKEELWNRFKEATNLINKKHAQYYEQIKEQQGRNLEAKEELCIKAEALLKDALHQPKEWEDKSNELFLLQDSWKQLGYAPKKDNVAVYDRFRVACDAFFDAKREFFKNYKSDQQNNLSFKLELCEQADALKNSTEWRKATDEFIQLQKKWKSTGSVPRKHADAIWKRFREACDYFFDQKAHFFSQKDEFEDQNLSRKKELLARLAVFVPSGDGEQNFRQLQDFQQLWGDIGHVPMGQKDVVNQEFRQLINKHFDHLNMDEFNKNVHKFRSRLENLKQEGASNEKINTERNKIIAKLRQLESDITLWENNIGFFAKSKKSEALIRDFQHKIENGKKNIDLLNKKLDLIDDQK